MAYRSTAQVMSHRDARSSKMSLEEVVHTAERHVGGPLAPSGDLGPRQSAMYIQFKAMCSQLNARQALQDAQAIVIVLKFHSPVREHCNATQWLGKTIHDLKRHATGINRSAPIFAAELTRGADAIIAQHPDALQLQSAIRSAEDQVDALTPAPTCLPSLHR